MRNGARCGRCHHRSTGGPAGALGNLGGLDGRRRPAWLRPRLARHGREAERQELTNGWHGKRPAQGQGDRTKVDRGARKDRRRLRQGAEPSQCRLLGANGEGAQGGRGFSFRQTGPRLDLPREAAGEPLLIRSEPTFRAEIRARGKDRVQHVPSASPDRRAAPRADVALGRPVRVPSSEESGAPGAEPGAWWVWTALAPVAPSQGW